MRRDVTSSSVPESSIQNTAVGYANRPKILSLTCSYPNPLEPGIGIFVQRRLRHVAELADIEVVAPFAVVKYSNAPGERVRAGAKLCPIERMDGKVRVVHPRWLYTPSSGVLTAFWLFLQVLPPVLRIRRRFPFQILDTHFGCPDGIAGWLISLVIGVPFTMTLRGNEPRQSRSGPGRYCMRAALRRASRVLTVSERLRQFAIELGADPGKVRTIPNGVDDNTFYPRDRVRCRSKHGFHLDRPLIVSAGALVERKGHHRVITALKSISAGKAGPQLAIAGGAGPEGRYESVLRQLVADLNMQDSVQFLGNVDSNTLAELMSAADVFCLASTNEGWPNVVHEALACGAPVVATDVGAVPDMLQDGRGIVVPTDDRNALQEALRRALSQDWDRDRISAWGRSRSWTHVAQEVDQEMQYILSETRNKV